MIGPGTAAATFPKIELPGVDQEQAQAVSEILSAAEEHAQYIKGQQGGMLLAMLRLRKPISTGRRKRPARPATPEGNVFARMDAGLAAKVHRRSRRAAVA